jgi:hypothetical protein
LVHIRGTLLSSFFISNKHRYTVWIIELETSSCKLYLLFIFCRCCQRKRKKIEESTAACWCFKVCSKYRIYTNISIFHCQQYEVHSESHVISILLPSSLKVCFLSKPVVVTVQFLARIWIQLDRREWKWQDSNPGCPN